MSIFLNDRELLALEGLPHCTRSLYLELKRKLAGRSNLVGRRQGITINGLRVCLTVSVEHLLGQAATDWIPSRNQLRTLIKQLRRHGLLERESSRNPQVGEPLSLRLVLADLDGNAHLMHTEKYPRGNGAVAENSGEKCTPNAHGQMHTEIDEEHPADEVSVLVEFLNQKTGKNFRARGPNGRLTSTGDLVVALLKQGYTATEIRKVIARKCGEWLPCEDMRVYCRPSTLFRASKFPEYLGECTLPSMQRRADE